MLDIMFTHCAGADVHKKSVSVCVLVPGQKGKVRRLFKTFGTTTKALQERYRTQLTNERSTATNRVRSFFLGNKG